MRVSGSGAAVLLLFGLVSWSRGQETIKKLSGSNVTFKANVTGGPSEIAWFQGTSKIVDLEEGFDPQFYRLEERTVPDLAKGTLLLMNVSPADSGPYRAELLIGSSYSYIHFNLQVFDHVCQVVIQNSTQENNVTLQCTCSAPSADPPARYQWYNGSDCVSDVQNITIQKEDNEQLLRCNGSNEVSWTNATITVPGKEITGRTHIIIICLIVFVIILLSVIIFIYVKNANKRSRTLSDKTPDKTSDKTPELTSLLPKPTGETVAPSEILFKKAGETLMSIALHLPVLCLERLSVQRDVLKIMDVRKEDYGLYKAEVLLREKTTNTYTFLCKSAQNGEIGQQHDAEAELVNPENGELTMKIPDTESAERIIWSKDGAEILAVTCSPSYPEGLVLYRGALSTGLVSDGDRTHWDDVARPDGTSVEYVFRLNDAALNSGSIRLYPVIVEREERITWTTDGEELATWKAGEGPKYSRGEALCLESGRLTLRNLKERCAGQYIMEAAGPRTPRQEFSLTVQPLTAS